VLELAFRDLRAVEAHTSFVEGNIASERVSRRLGYRPNGRRAFDRDGDRVVEKQRLASCDSSSPSRRSVILSRCLESL
jgi:RimJ/RimL family protein N-acetyltransferase